MFLLSLPLSAQLALLAPLLALFEIQDDAVKSEDIPKPQELFPDDNHRYVDPEYETQTFSKTGT